MNVREKNLILSSGWLITAVVTFVLGFAVLGYLDLLPGLRVPHRIDSPQ